MDNIFPTSKYRYVFSISKHSKIKSLKIVNSFRAGGSGKLEGRFSFCVLMYTPFSYVLNTCIHSTKVLSDTLCIFGGYFKKV